MSDAAGDWVIKGARPLGGQPSDILIRGAMIKEVGRGLGEPGARVLDAGGLIALPSLLPPGSIVSLIFVVPKGPIAATAEMLRPVSWTEQPFRFAALPDSGQHRLRAVIDMVYGTPE